MVYLEYKKKPGICLRLILPLFKITGAEFIGTIFSREFSS